MSSKAINLFVASVLALFLELACIRWISGSVRIVAYSVNLILLASFLGLGIGLIKRGRDLRVLLLVSLFLIGIFVPVFRRVETVVPGESIAVWSSYGLDSVLIVARNIPFHVVLLAFFILCVTAFVPIGQAIARSMEGLPPLKAYAINIGGSLAGVALFALAGALWTGPEWWLGFSLAMIACVFRDKLPYAVAACVLAAALIGISLVENKDSIWSPYQKITTRARPDGFDLYVNDDRHQFALDLRNPRTEQEKEWRRVYDFPYKSAPKLDNVLIVGAGSGNDVAGALRNAARHVDAVDIDPGIVRIGTERHPEKPYSDPRVTRHIQDARAFFKQSDGKYDLVVFGYLDSHALFSSMANVRLDEYVYTLESFREAYAHVAPGGAMCVVFCAVKPWIRGKLVKTLAEVAGKPPLIAILNPEGVDTTILWIGTSPTNAEIRMRTAVVENSQAPHDDWPFLYLEEHSLPLDYLIIMIGILVAGAATTGMSSTKDFSWVFFFLGAGFMLLETLSITRFALVAGSTWIITSLTVGTILLMALISTFVVGRFQKPGARAALVLTLAAIAVSFSIPSETFMGMSFAARLAAGALVIGLPVLFSGIAFSRLFSGVENAGAALGANLFGAVFGGVCEYFSMITGFRILYLAAAVFYIGAMVSLRRTRE